MADASIQAKHTLQHVLTQSQQSMQSGLLQGPTSNQISHSTSVFSMICSALQDLSRPSASSSASLARMIGGLALAGATADITDHPPSPRPARGVPPQASGSSLNPQSGFSSVSAADASELHSVASGAGNAAAGSEGQDPNSEGKGQAGTSYGAWEGSHARQGEVAGAMRQLGGASASHDQAALAQNNVSAPAAGPASGAAGISNSSAAGAAVGSHRAPWSSNDDKGGYSSRGAAAESAARQDPTGGAASALGYQGPPADPSSIAAYRPEGIGQVDDGHMAAGFGDGVGVDGRRQGGASSTGLDSDDSSRRHRNAVSESNRPGGGADAGRRANPSGMPVQVRVCFLCLQAFDGNAQAELACCSTQVPPLLLDILVIQVLSMGTVRTCAESSSELVQPCIINAQPQTSNVAAL